MSVKNILVTGATGKQGGALITALLASTQPGQFHIFALTRNLQSASALLLASQNVTVIQGDLAKSKFIFAQIPDIYGIFLVTVPSANEESLATAFINCAAAAGVQHFIFSSVDRGGPVKSEGNPTIVPHFGAKMQIEEYLKVAAEKDGGKMKWTILRPTSFMDNLSPGFIGKATTTMFKQMGSTRISLIATRDIGRAAARVFEDPDRFAGRAITLTGDVLTFEEMNGIFKEEVGREIPLTWELVVNVLQWAIGDLRLTMEFCWDGGWDYDLDEEVKRDLGLSGFRSWVRESGNFEGLRRA